MKTKDVETLLNTTKQTLIYYEKEGLITPSRDENNYRNYSLDDIETIKFIILMRSMELSIEEIQSILNGQVNLTDALKDKQEALKKAHIELEDANQKIENYIKRIPVYVSFHQENTCHLCLLDEFIVFDHHTIHLQDIEKISLSMCSQLYTPSLIRVYLNYYIDLDIRTKKQTYSFQIMNDKCMQDVFAYFQHHHIFIEDPLNCINVYNQYPDPVARNKFLDHHFQKWSKQYHLDNPRISMCHYSTYGIDTAKDIHDQFHLKNLFHRKS